MRILLVTPLLDVGGGQRYITELANYWSDNNHDVHIVVLRKGEIFYDISQKVKIIELSFNYSGVIDKIAKGFRTGYDLRRIVKQINPDFILSILATTNLLTIMSTLLMKTPVIIRDAFSPTRKRGFFEGILRKNLYRFASGIIAQTDEIKRAVEKETGHKNVKTIQNPVRNFNVEDIPRREKIVLNIGALTTRKGQRYFIEACSKLNHPDWRFIILGEGEIRKSLENLIEELNVDDQVQLMGAVKDVDEWLLKSSIFVFPSLLEGLPNALIEAMSSGLACVSFDCETGPRDLIMDNQNGFLIPSGNIQLLTERIEELMNNEELRNEFSVQARKSTEKLKVEYIAQEVMNFCTEN